MNEIKRSIKLSAKSYRRNKCVVAHMVVSLLKKKNNIDRYFVMLMKNMLCKTNKSCYLQLDLWMAIKNWDINIPSSKHMDLFEDLIKEAHLALRAEAKKLDIMIALYK